MSKNRHTIEQLQIACRHVRELMAAGVTENHAIRTLELLSDFYAKLHTGGPPSPHHVSHVAIAQWSVAALAHRRDNPTAKPRDHLRVEHGTPRRAFARMVLDLDDRGELNADSMDVLGRRYWKLAVITVEEDAKLARIARSKMYGSPDERWQAAGISFAPEGAVPLASPDGLAKGDDPIRSSSGGL